MRLHNIEVISCIVEGNKIGGNLFFLISIMIKNKIILMYIYKFECVLIIIFIKNILNIICMSMLNIYRARACYAPPKRM